MDGFGIRASLKGMGLTGEAFEGRPIIGICNSYSEFTHCNSHFQGLVKHIRRGVEQAGGLALEFPVISLGEPFMAPTTMLFRNLMAMDVEECIRAYPMDAVVLLGGCDKTIPAMIMGALSADVPAILIPGGPQLNARFDGEDVGTCTDCWRTSESVRAGTLDPRRPEAPRRRDHPLGRPLLDHGHGVDDGVARRGARVHDAGRGRDPGGRLAAPAPRRAGRTGRGRPREVGPAPSDIISQGSIANADDRAAGPRRLDERASCTSRRSPAAPDWTGTSTSSTPSALRTPWLTNLKPSGSYLMEDFFDAGGVPALLSELRDLLDLSARSVLGVSIGEVLGDTGTRRPEVIAAGDSAAAGDRLDPRAARQSRASRRGREGDRRHRGAHASHRTRGRLRRSRRHGGARRGPVARHHRRLGAGPPRDGPGRRSGHAREGPHPDPGPPAQGRRVRHGADQRRPDERDRVRHLRAARRRRSRPSAGRWRSCATATWCSSTSRRDCSSCWCPTMSSRAATPRRARRRTAARSARGYRKLYVEHVLQADEGCDFDFLRATAERDRGALLDDRFGVLGFRQATCAGARRPR